MIKRKKTWNGEAYYTYADISPKKMKGVKEMFKDIEHIRIPISGAQLLKRIRKENRITPLRF